MKDDLTFQEWLALQKVGGRQKPEESRALPRRFYGNPLDSYEFPSERLRKEEAKRVERANKRRK